MAERSHGSWYLRIELGTGTDGHRRRVRRGGFPSRKAVLEALVRLRGPAGSPLTVAEGLQRWLDNHQGAVYHLIALRGLRRGEAAGLRWCEVDLDAGTAVICRQVQRRNGRLTACAPKTPHSNRVLALDRTTVAALRAHRSRQRAEQEAFGEGYRDSGYVFTNLNGEPVSPGWLTHQFQRLIAEQDMPPIRLHDLRHGAATLALAAGVELKVSASSRPSATSIGLTRASPTHAR